VAIGAICVDQLLNASSLINLIIMAKLLIGRPSNWLVWDVQGSKDFIIETFSSQNLFMHSAQEIT